MSGPNPATRMPAAEAQALVFKERDGLNWFGKGPSIRHIAGENVRGPLVYVAICGNISLAEVHLSQPVDACWICTRCARAWIKERAR